MGLVVLSAIGRIPGPAEFAAWGAEPLRALQKELYRPDRGIYTDPGPVTTANPLGLPAQTELISALAAGATYDPKLKPDLELAIAAAEKYWDPSGATPGFADMPGGAGGTRSYAHNASLAVVLLEAARVATPTKASAMAEQALTFVLSGEGAKDGGIADAEGAGAPRSANATATAAQAILSQADVSTPAHARELYEWVRTALRDPATNLFSPEATPPQTPRASPTARDTARLIQVACMLKGLTGEEKFGEQARRLEDLSVGRWYRQVGSLDTDTVGGAELLEAWIARLRLCPRPGETYGATEDAYAALKRLHDAGRDSSGHYGPKFGVKLGKQDSWRVIDQAAAARAFFVAALALRPAKK
ncbi:MAG: hypothetical protein ACYC96_09345 [Fimbriimonadaceae bacterium]